MDKSLRDLIDIIQFTENVAARIHGIYDEETIFRIVTEEFVSSERSMTGILMMDDDGSSLKVAQVSLSPDVVRTLEKAADSPIEDFRTDLVPGSILSRVVTEGKTLNVKSGDMFRDMLPPSLASLVMEIMQMSDEPSIITPLHRREENIGILMIIAPDLAEYFLPSVRNLARHISTALELADEQAERKRAEEMLRKHQDDLEKLVQERTSSLEEANTALRVMLKTADQVKSEVEEAVLFNVKRFTLAYLEELGRSGLNDRQHAYLDLLRQSLDQVTQPFVHGVSSKFLTLTPTEVMVMDLIRQGKSSKEIADLLNISIRTVETHRYNVRTKLGLKERSINLRTYLSSIEEYVDRLSNS